MARTFNGTSDHIAFGSDVAYDQLATFTAYALLRPTATVTAEKQVLSKMTSGYAGKMYIALIANDKIFCYINRMTTDCTSASANSTLVTDVWNVVIVTWAGVGSAAQSRAATNASRETTARRGKDIGAGSMIMLTR